MTCPDKVDHLQ